MVISVWVAYRIGKRSREKLLKADGDFGPAKQVVADLETISQQVRRSPYWVIISLGFLPHLGQLI